MISVLLLLVLAWSFYIGYRRGLVLQIYYFVATVISALLAGNFYQSLGKQFDLLIPYASPQQGQGTFFFPSNQLFQLDKVFYAGIGYLLAARGPIFSYRCRCFISGCDLICPPDDTDHSCDCSFTNCSKFT